MGGAGHAAARGRAAAAPAGGGGGGGRHGAAGARRELSTKIRIKTKIETIYYNNETLYQERQTGGRHGAAVAWGRLLVRDRDRGRD